MVALALLLSTAALAVRSLTRPESGFVGVIGGPESTVYLRSEPQPAARVVTVADRGDSVWVAESRPVDDRTWLKVETEAGTGWVPADVVVLRAE